MMRRLGKLITMALMICFLIGTLPSTALAAGCKWTGTTMRKTVAAKAATVKIKVNCEGVFDYDIDVDDNLSTSSSAGYDNDWVRVTKTNKSYVWLRFDENYFNKPRECVVTLVCRKHGETKTLIITQKKSTKKAPSVTAKLNNTSVKPGEKVKLTVSTKNGKRLFVNFAKGGFGSNWIRKIGNGTYSCIFTVPNNMAAGTYAIPVEVSNSPKENDAWARRSYRTVQLTVKGGSSSDTKELSGYFKTNIHNTAQVLGGLDYTEFSGEDGIHDIYENDKVILLGWDTISEIRLTAQSNYTLLGIKVGMGKQEAKKRMQSYSIMGDEDDTYGLTYVVKGVYDSGNDRYPEIMLYIEFDETEYVQRVSYGIWQ